MVRNKLKLLLFLLLMALPAELSAVSDDAKVLMNRQFALYDTDSVDAFKDVTARLKQLLEKEGEASGC